MKPVPILALLACLLVGLQLQQEVGAVRQRGGPVGMTRSLLNQDETLGDQGWAPPFSLAVPLGPEAEQVPALAALANAALSLARHPRLALTPDQQGRLGPLRFSLLRCREDMEAARDGLLAALTPGQRARLARPLPPGEPPPAPPTPEGDEPVECALARGLLEHLEAGPGVPVPAGTPTGGSLAQAPPLLLLEALHRELGGLGFTPGQVADLRLELGRVVQAGRREIWLKERTREVFRPDQLAWLEGRNSRVSRSRRSPVPALLQAWLQERAAEASP